MELKPTVKLGSSGPAVEKLQQALNKHGASLATDGIFGRATGTALRAWQQNNDLIADGIAGAKTWAVLSGTPLPATLTHADIKAAAKTLGIDVAAMLAVNSVESRGSGFRGSLPVVLFERHIMYRQLRDAGYKVDGIAATYPDLVNASPGGYKGGTQENKRLDRARAIDEHCANCSASYGLFQIMGFWYERVGYTTPHDYATAMCKDEQTQLAAFVKFIETGNGLRRALREHDWVDFARRYNGPNYAQNDYDHKLAAAYRRHKEHN